MTREQSFTAIDLSLNNNYWDAFFLGMAIILGVGIDQNTLDVNGVQGGVSYKIIRILTFLFGIWEAGELTMIISLYLLKSRLQKDPDACLEGDMLQFLKKTETLVGLKKVVDAKIVKEDVKEMTL